ncbi:cytochrome c/c1 heme-lyase [Podospora didyma]|uniref:Holocytochrome c-type synthase n=1 Tax=Podospora didyma TaxID=330526 RepID=A0AAE0NQF8_9PEZI|nr:cytochrome c/c1 heme-lyase [Podospora didyma]
MHTDLLDTVLVSHKDSTLAGPCAVATPAAMKGTTTTGTDREAAASAAVCPVDHKTRETWMQQARAANGGVAPPPPHGGPGGAGAAAQMSAAATPSLPAGKAAIEPAQSSSWSSWLRSPFTSSSPSQPQAPSSQTAQHPKLPALGETREVSSIPRSSTPGPSSCPDNSEQETGASKSGNWVYPSEKMFFEAMKRKGYGESAAAEMKTVVPIHNAVNERAWGEILRWEAPYVAPAAGGGANACGGPRLHSFEGLSKRMSPRARINTLLGYTAPFDRHDWVVDRCGTRVEYIIDFYAGRNDPSAAQQGGGGKINFYLDVRPKLNTWEGIKMRALRATGLA